MLAFARLNPLHAKILDRCIHVIIVSRKTRRGVTALSAAFPKTLEKLRIMYIAYNTIWLLAHSANLLQPRKWLKL
jgi:hypothetical protein